MRYEIVSELPVETPPVVVEQPIIPVIETVQVVPETPSVKTKSRSRRRRRRVMLKRGDRVLHPFHPGTKAKPNVYVLKAILGEGGTAPTVLRPLKGGGRIIGVEVKRLVPYRPRPPADTDRDTPK